MTNKMTVAVSVATVWTKPESARPVDEPALQRPVRLPEWLERMKLDERLDLCNANRVQTQVLYGASVLVVEERGDWVKVLVPQQATPKDARGYPGWVPRCQLAYDTAAPAGAGSLRAEVVSDKAMLYRLAASDSDPEPLTELSFLTSLPVLDQVGKWVKVRTPEGGCGYLRDGEVRLIGGPLAPVPEGVRIGDGIVEQGKRFLGLPYLWGGMSAYGFDCSGFAYTMHRYFGILIPRDASVQSQHGEPIEAESLEPGDLLFFGREGGKDAVHHVGIYAGGGRMIHSPESGRAVELVDLQSYHLAQEHCISSRYWNR
jgi:hypothetical protein